jgi:hypothetical protein
VHTIALNFYEMKKFLLVLFSALTLNGFGAAFTPGNIVVVRLGDGSASLTNSATPVFLDEYTTNGTLVQSIALPTTLNGANRAFTLSGTATSEGALSLSANGQFLTLAGYDAPLAYPSVSSDSSINRTIARVDAMGNINTSTGLNANTGYKKNNIRAVVSNDGTQFWCAGSGTSSSGGTYYLPFGSFTNAPIQVSTSITNTRTINIFNNQLYVSSASSTFHGISNVGNGLPTTSGQNTTILPGFSSTSGPSSYAFSFLDLSPTVPGVDVVYVADDRTTSPDGGIYKYSLVGGTWVSNGNITSSVGLRGLVAAKTCSAVNIITSGDANIYSMVDASGYNQTISGTLTQIATSGTNKKFRGVSFTPLTSTIGLIAAVSSATNVSCFNGNNGAISVNTTGATGNISYNWGGGITTPNRNNLAAGTYIVTVTDQAGCTDTTSATITQPAQLLAVATPVNVSCFGDSSGAINLTTTGGTPNYAFNWGSGVTTQNRSNIAAGNYIVTVTDSKSCTATASATVTQPSPISVNGTLTNLPCTGGSSGAISLAVSGGDPGYTFLWSNTAITQNINALPAGNYSVTVTDASSCTATSTFTLSQSGSLSATPTITNVACFGGNNGSINIATTGGTPTYNYAWSNNSSSQNISGLTSGTYTVTITDNGGCALINSFNVVEPALLAITSTVLGVSCNGNNNGSVDVSVAGGTNPYTYNWGGGIITEDRNNLSAGTYAVTITDANSCTSTISAIVTQPDLLSLSLTPVDASAVGASDGSVTLVVAGGTSPISSYSWSNGSGTQNISNVPADNYCVTVTDAKSCTASSCINVGQPSSLEESEWLSNWKIYSTSNGLFIQLSFVKETEGTISLFNVSGQKIMEESFFDTDMLDKEISFAGLSNGIYLLHIKTEKNGKTIKVAVNQ